jgi:RimJ/RimL family protein N-acetyltransferase
LLSATPRAIRLSYISYVIETERLILRRPALEDFDRWAEMMADPDAARYIGGVQAKAAAWRGLMTVTGAWTLTGVGMFSVVEKSRNIWIGRIGPWQPHGWPGTEVGWALHPDAWGKGYAVEAAAAAIDYAFDTLGWTDVVHCINADNAPSQAVARKLGSAIRAQGRLPAPYEHEVVDIWAQTRDEWKSRTAGLRRD